ncbi:MAG: hypothetical protein A3F70_00570 [Acidobacteria bacterium RIFCSPLOWO2_12_FULL_67_14]|nr:MAG: hypothetical protein A3H29_12905 [Acidobacteria bacterium RIFCSPLOWO2_02_FULL_67_21]OFW38762.1 MAG: hypothetical protein A3F70_00570 [Acidobacteria bacterium RIFCSPLOWO2_12_FULL_67_14]
MADDLERVLKGLDEAAAFARTYRFEMTDEYRALIARVEALPANRPGADKSWVWRLIDSSARFYKSAVRVR